jgi:putative peptidoglycan lipid II flippase
VLKVESYRKGIILSSFFNIFYKGLVFINSLLVAYYFGTEVKMDIYFYAYNTVMIIATFIASANSSVIIPESMRLRVREGQDKAMGFLNYFIYAYIGLTLMIALVFLTDPIRIFTMFSKYDVNVLAPRRHILYLAVPLVLLMPVTTLLTDILASYRFFTIPVIAGMINSVCSIIFVVFFHNILDITSILMGLILAYSFNILMLLYLMVRHLKWKFRASRQAVSKKALNNLVYSQTGNFLTSLGSYAPLYFLSGTVPGIIAALNYAQQIVTQANSFITYQVSVVSRIKLSELYAQKKYKKVNDIFVSTIKFLLFILVPISGLLFLYTEEIITLLFKRGSFTERSVQLSTDMLRYLALSLPFTAIVSIAGNLYVAAQLIRISIIYQVISNLILIGLIALLVNRISYIGYPVAFLLINILNVLIVYVYCRYFFPFIRYAEVLKYLAYMILLNIPVIILLKTLSMYRETFGSIQLMILGGLIYSGIMLAINLRFRLNDDFNNLLIKVGQKIGVIKTSQ